MSENYYQPLDETEERAKCIRQIYNALNRNLKDDVLAFIVKKTSGIDIIRFTDTCRRLESYREMPDNLSLEIITLAGKKQNELKACPECCVYKDGMPEIISGQRWPFAPGMRFYYKSEGTIYDRVGYTTPCGCESGRKIAKEIEMRANRK